MYRVHARSIDTHVAYAHIMIIYIVHAYFNRSYMYCMHDYPICARACHGEREREI